MQRVIPAIIPRSRHHLDTMLEKTAAFSDEVQVDIVDGIFDDSVSWPYNTGTSLAESLSGVQFDTLSVGLDLMIQNPEESLEKWCGTGAQRVIVHIESTPHLSDILVFNGPRACHTALAFSNDADLGLLDSIDLASVDFIQLMGIAEIGEQGNAFDERVIPRIKEVKEKYPKLSIQIDGHVDQKTLPLLKKAGASRFIVGSAIWKSEHPEESYRELCQLAEKV